MGNKFMALRLEKSIIIKIPKKGDLTLCKNWRGITLLSVPGKVMSTVIMNRIRDGLENTLREQQAGFRRNRGCCDHIFVIRNIIEQCEEQRSPLIMNFVDFMRAFDSVHRKSICNIMASYGFPEVIVSLIKTMYEGSISCVRVGQENTEWFDINTGVRQGDVLSPFLFNIVLVGFCHEES